MQHKNIIITGATDGIGLAAAKSIAKKGYHVSLVGRNPDKGKKALEAIIEYSGNENLDFFECDLSLVANVKDLAYRIKQKHSKIDVLLNNAGGANKTKQITSEGLEKTFATNQMNYFVLSTELLNILSESNDGRIVNVASVAGKDGNANASAYSAGKAGAIGLTKSLGKELADKNIAVNAITPAGAKTRILDQMSKEHVQKMLSKVPRGRFLEVHEFTSLVCWLSSEENTFSTAAVFDISGGRSTY